MPNPFFYGGHVQPDQFVGRKHELRRIFSALDTAHTGQLQSISVVGPRRIGKSSLLFYVAHRFSQHLSAPQNYRFTYVELPSAECRTLDGLVSKILRDLGANGNKKQPPLVRFESAIHALKASGVCPVVCVDEFEELTDHRDEFPHDVYDSWRALINSHAIAFITASKSPLADLATTHGYTSPFFNVFTYLPLGELTDDEARALIERGANGDQPFTPTEMSEVLTLAGNHPYRLQLAGSLVYETKADNRALDWAEIRRAYIQQLQQVGLEIKFGRVLASAGRKFGNAASSTGKFAFQEAIKAWIDSIFRPK
ncbi:MAG: ATP-binding protein [Chloroflexi bacterium]|nr:ATP-binding protein [Chloroflexota bacterium]